VSDILIPDNTKEKQKNLTIDEGLKEMLKEHFLTFPRRFEFILIPLKIAYCPYLTPTEKFLYSEIRSLDNEKTGCYASNDYFAKLLNVHKQSITNMIVKLKKAGIVIEESFNGRKRVLRTNDEGIVPYYIDGLKKDILNNHKLNNLCRLNDTIYSDQIVSFIKEYRLDNSKEDKEISKDILSDSANPSETFFPKRKAPQRNEEIISKEIPSKKPIFKLEDEEMKILQYWNDIPELTTHKNEPTETLKIFSLYFKYLTKGIFFKRCLLDKEKLSWYKIPDDWHDKKFTTREIICAIGKYQKCFLQGNYPLNKKTLTKRIDEFFYNPRTGSSWFLSCLSNGVQTIHEEVKDYNPQYTKYFQERGLLKYFSEKDYKKIYNGIKSIENRVVKDEIFDFTLPNPKLAEVIGKGMGQLEPMFQGYAKHLNNFNRIDDPEKMFSPYGYFQGYLEELENTYSSFKVNI